MSATIKDVAALAGVGVGTVSRYINNESVKESTRIKIEVAIKELNYELNEYARGLKMNRTNTVALILPTIWHPFFSEFAYYIESSLSTRNYKVYLCNSDQDSQKERGYIQMVTQNKVDGIIGITYNDIDQYISANLPFVSIDRHFTENVSYVTADNYNAGEIAVEKLIENDCKILAYIGGYSLYPNETVNRLKGFEECATKNQIQHEILYLKEPFKDLKGEVIKFIRRNPKIDGIFCINDFMALDVMEILEEIDINVPEDIQIIGCDGIKLSIGRKVILSTVEQPLQQMAEAAVKSLLHLINKEETSKRIILPVRYIEGNTTKNKINH
ncbi:MAG: rbsR2 [Clostridiaceae bacterium]|jgi:LacI family transcriptional regulator|nr:rbsR2 [Clostridiaceae bacterium]